MSRWIVAGTDAADPYPCRCFTDRKPWVKECSAAWCPCAGRADPPSPACCGTWFRPRDVVVAKAEWDLKRRD